MTTAVDEVRPRPVGAGGRQRPARARPTWLRPRPAQDRSVRRGQQLPLRRRVAPAVQPTELSKESGGGGSRIRLTMRSTTLRSWNLACFASSTVPRTPWSAADRSELQRNRCSQSRSPSLRRSRRRWRCAGLGPTRKAYAARCAESRSYWTSSRHGWRRARRRDRGAPAASEMRTRPAAQGGAS